MATLTAVLAGEPLTFCVIRSGSGYGSLATIYAPVGTSTAVTVTRPTKCLDPNFVCCLVKPALLESSENRPSHMPH